MSIPMIRWLLPIVVLLVTVSATANAQARPAQGKSPARRQGQPTTVPAAPDPRAAAAVRAVDSNTLPAFAAAVEADLAQLLSDLNQLDPEKVTAAVAFREFGRYFGRITNLPGLPPAQRETLKWLAAQPRLLPVLVLAVSDADAPENVLAVLTALRLDQGNNASKLNEYADLTAALCVVWDAPPPAGASRPSRASAGGPSGSSSGSQSSVRPPDPQTAAKRFRYYSDSRQNLRGNFKTLPWQLAVYAIDHALGDQEIAWAAQAYGGRRSLSRVYFEVPYDDEAFERGERRADALPYTLPNIREYGGVCLDQAYFAAHVGKALGQPAAVCTGLSGSQGELHAWIGYLQPAGKSAAWNFHEGRYGSMMFWTVQVNDPQGGPAVTDADVSLLSELTATPEQRRLASLALCKVRDRVGDDRAADLYMKAIDLSPGNRPAWMALADLGATGKLPREQVNRVASVVQRFAVERYPDFAFAVYRRIISGQSVDDQLAATNNIARQFALRPDLIATVRVAQGDLLRGANRNREALAAYRDATSDAQRIGSVLPQAMDRIDDLLRAAGESKKLLDVYRDVWTRTPTPQPSGYADVTPFCIIGKRYAALLRETGDARQAASVEQRVSAYMRQPVKR